MRSTKNPEHEAENPAPMPVADQGKKMAPRQDAPPGIETDGEGNVIPLGQRTKEDQDKAARGGNQGGYHR